MDGLSFTSRGPLTLDQIARYRRDGFIVIRGLLDQPTVAASLEALTAIAEEAVVLGDSKALLERAIDASAVTARNRLDHVRKFVDFTDDFPVLRRVAMFRPLHQAIDQLQGEGRVLFQEMALVKPPKIGSAKRWHQDASYFRVSDPTLITGVWIALDPATEANGCMQAVAGSHLGGPVSHVPMGDVNECHIRPDLVTPEQAQLIEMQPGDAMIFHACLHHYTAPNLSGLRRRALQYHYHQIGMDWLDLEAHRRHYHDEAGLYSGCTVPAEPIPEGVTYTYRPGRPRTVTPID